MAKEFSLLPFLLLIVFKDLRKPAGHYYLKNAEKELCRPEFDPLYELNVAVGVESLLHDERYVVFH